MIRKVVILAAGRGTRLLPITSVVAKELLPIIDTPVIEYVLQEAIIPGVEEVILVTNKQKTSLVEYLSTGGSPSLKKLIENVSLRVVYQEERTSDYGTGAGLLSVIDEVKGAPFSLIFADSFGLQKDKRIEEMADLFEKFGIPIVSLIPIKQEQLQTYGIPITTTRDDGQIRITEILEKPAHFSSPEPMATPGAFILTPDIVSYVEKVNRDANGEIPFSIALSDYCKEHEVIGHLFKGHFFEAGNRADFAKSVIEMSLLRDDTANSVRTLLGEIQKSPRVNKDRGI